MSISTSTLAQSRRTRRVRPIPVLVVLLAIAATGLLLSSLVLRDVARGSIDAEWSIPFAIGDVAVAVAH
jgi:hypothetical protein